jgi:hypothetical protein
VSLDPGKITFTNLTPANLPFMGILTERPYPPTGLTTARWIENVFSQPVYLRDLWLTQNGVRIGPLFGLTDIHASADIYPHVVSWRGELYLEDGHHRVVREALAGVRVMAMRVFTIAAEVPAPTDAPTEQEAKPSM